jgi:hypothetical protein
MSRKRRKVNGLLRKPEEEVEEYQAEEEEREKERLACLPAATIGSWRSSRALKAAAPTRPTAGGELRDQRAKM